jgi:hypothetical protein
MTHAPYSSRKRSAFFRISIALSLIALLLALVELSGWAAIKVVGDAAFKAQVQQCLDRYQKAGGDFGQILSTLQSPGKEHTIRDYRQIQSKAEKEVENLMNNNQELLDLIGGDKSKKDEWLSILGMSKPEKNSTIPVRARDAVPATFTFTTAGGVRGTGRGSGSVITVDPSYAAELDPGVKADFCSTLIHEMAHAREMHEGKLDPRPEASTKTRISEVNATSVENRWRADNGLQQRPTYSGDKLPTSAFVFPLAKFEAERQRIEKLVNQSNKAYEAFTKLLDELLQKAKDKATELQTELDKIIAKVPALDSFQQSVNEIKQQADTVINSAKDVQDPADQVCQLVEYASKEREKAKQDELIQAAKKNLTDAEQAFKKIETQAQKIKDALGPTSQEASQIKDKISQAAKEILALIANLEKTLKAEAATVEKLVTTSLDSVKQPADQATQAADALGGLIDQTIGLNAFNPSQVQQLNAVKQATKDTMNTLKAFSLFGVNRADAKALATAKQGQDLVEAAKKTVSDQLKELDTKKETVLSLLKEMTDNALDAALALSQAESNVKHARTCLDKFLNPATKTTLVGYVYDKKTNKPIVGASVAVSGLFNRRVVSNSSGNFTLTGVLLDTVVDINVSKKGYSRRLKSVKVVDEDPLVNFPLEPRKGGNATLKGIVVDKETGKPIAKASVNVEGQNVTADAGGNFSVTGLPEETLVTVVAEARDYLAASRTKKTTKSEASVTLPLLSDVKSVEIRWTPADPKPGQGVTVTAAIFPRRANIAIRVTVTGTDGYYDSRIHYTDANGQVAVFVPGAKQGVKDTMVADVLGRPLKKVETYVF